MDFIYSFLSEGMDNRPAYGFSNRMRAAVEKDQVTPSPSDYYAENCNLGSNSQSFSFGHRPRTNYVRNEDTPGPGEYFISEQIPKRRKSGYSFGSKTASNRRSLTPGPKYLLNESGSFHPQRGYSFGHRPTFGRRISDTPGPGEYEQEPFLFKNTPAYTFGVKNPMRGRNDFLRNRTPAPADYRPEVGAKKRAPGYSFGTTSRPRVFGPTDFDSPGPGEYFHSSKFSNQQKGFSFGLRFPTLIK